ncbi:MAG: TerC family protein, partial [Verrucomicrobiae bacterium]|nr:TerC family protein [Verrucomicrobiae bacterium]
PFYEYWWLYIGFVVFLLLVLGIDLGVFHRKAHEVGYREALTWTVVWVTLAMIFNVLLYYFCLWEFRNNDRLMSVPGFDPHLSARQSALEFLAGYIVEYSLSVDNVFVFVVIFKYFDVAPKYQHRILFYGVLGAVFFRALFIALGSLLMALSWFVFVMGLFLILTGLKIVFMENHDPDPEKNWVIRLLKKFLPITHTVEGPNFFVKHKGILYGTPLLVCLVFIEVTDIVFAIDSVPAIFAITREPMIVFTSNLFAIMGLRTMYFLLGGIMDQFRFLKYGLGAVLVFVGMKMTFLNHLFGGHFPIVWSLAFIVTAIGLSILLSWLIKEKHAEK